MMKRCLGNKLELMGVEDDKKDDSAINLFAP